uniref:Neurotransmitter-gated ion-channel ligand-binding domain-containing protein n=1 Tax=Timema shepardi TaxID=629360 RepID=A0A7R9ANL8_TIMSH|nr:unnamed protein product [Timema shepardi]
MVAELETRFTLSPSMKSTALGNVDSEEMLQEQIQQVYSTQCTIHVLLTAGVSGNVDSEEVLQQRYSSGKVDVGGVVTGTEQGPHERRLLNALLDHYNTLERPVSNESEPLEVKFGLTLQQIIDVDEKNQILTTNAWLNLVKEGFGNQINLCRDQGLNPGPIAEVRHLIPRPPGHP